MKNKSTNTQPTRNQFRSSVMGFGSQVMGGILGAISLLAIVSLSTSFKPDKPKPLAAEAGCYRPVYHFNNHCLEDLKANIEWYNCAGELKQTFGIPVPGTTEFEYTLPEDSEHINWVRLICPATNTGIASTSINTCTPAFASGSCDGTNYCVGFTYGATPWCLDGQNMNISYGPC